MHGDIFYRWMEKLIDFSKVAKDDPVLLILGGDASHVKNVIDSAIENSLIVACFLPHTTHRLQPLDVGFMNL